MSGFRVTRPKQAAPPAVADLAPLVQAYRAQQLSEITAARAAALAPTRTRARSRTKRARTRASRTLTRATATSSSTTTSTSDVVPDPSLDTAYVSAYTVNGTKLLDVTAAPQNYQDSSGAWVPIDSQFVPTTTGWTNAAGPVPLSLPSGLGAVTPIQMVVPQGSLLLWPDGLVSPISGTLAADLSTVTYAGLAAGTDLKISAMPGGLEQQVILTAAPSGSSLVFDVSAQGLSLAAEPSGGITVLSGAAVVGEISAPVVTDAAGVFGPAGGFTWSLADLGAGSYQLTLSYDSVWLADPTRVFPVTIDPSWSTTTISPPATNTDINPNSCAGHGASWYGLQVGGSCGYVTLLYYDVSTLVKNANRLTYVGDMWMVPHSGTGTSTSGTLNLKYLTQSFTTAATWPGPSYNSNTQASATGLTSGAEHWDVGGLFQKILSADTAAADYHGLRISTPTTEYHLFSSSDDTGCLGTCWPTLYLEYNDIPPAPTVAANAGTPADGGAWPDDQPTFAATSIPADSNGDTDTTKLDFQISDSLNHWGPDHLVDDSGPVSTLTWTADAGALLDGQKYYWRIESVDMCHYNDGSGNWVGPFECSTTDAAGVDHGFNVTANTRSFTITLPHYGARSDWSMWTDQLGNNMSLQVNAANGNAYLGVPLDSISTPMGPLALSLSYNSQLADAAGTTNDFGLGKGWQIGAGPGADPTKIPVGLKRYGANSSDEHGGVRITYADGDVVSIGYVTKHMFQSDKSLGGTVHESAGSTPVWTFETTSGDRYVFTQQTGDAADHYSLSEAEPAGSGWDVPGISYVYTNTGVGPRLTTVSFNAAGLSLPAVTHAVNFDYDNTTGQLLDIYTWLDSAASPTWRLGYYTAGLATGQLKTVSTNLQLSSGGGVLAQKVTGFFTYDANGVDLAGIEDGQQYKDNTSAGPSTKIGYTAFIAPAYNRVTSVWAPGTSQVNPRTVGPGSASVEPTTFTYTGWANLGPDLVGVGDVVANTKITDPRGNELNAPTSSYQTEIDLDTAGRPTRTSGPADQNGVWPETLRVWDSHGNLVCSRSPYANAFFDPVNPPQNTQYNLNACYMGNGATDVSQLADPGNTDYSYQPKAPYRLVSQDAPAPDALTSTLRQVTTTAYDEGFTGLKAQFFTGMYEAGDPASVFIDQAVNSNWGAAPSDCPTAFQTGGSCTDNWSGRWTGTITAATTGNYEIQVRADDFARASVGTAGIAECWGSPNFQAVQANCGAAPVTVRLVAGVATQVTVEYAHRTQQSDNWASQVHLEWDNLTKGATFSTIPSSVLSPELGDITSQATSDPAPSGYTGVGSTTIRDYSGYTDTPGQSAAFTANQSKIRDLPTQTATAAANPAYNATGTSRWTVYRYDALGNRTRLFAHPDSSTTLTSTWNYTWNVSPFAAAGDCLSSTKDPAQYAYAASTSYVCDWAGEVTRTSELVVAEPSTLSLAYPAPSHTVASQTRVIDTTYDPQGRVLTRSAAYDGTSAHTSTSITYDYAGRPLSSTDPRGDVTTNAYDDLLGELTSTRAPNPSGGGATGGPVTTFEYDEAGNSIGTRNDRGAVSYTSYDALNRVTGVTTPTGTTAQSLVNPPPTSGPFFTTVTTYTLASRTTSLATPGGPNASGVGTTITQVATADVLGRTVSTQTGALTAATSVYDTAGNLLSRTAGGSTTKITYSAFGQAVTWTCVSCYLQTTDEVTTNTYDLVGRLTSVLDPRGKTWTYVYDEAGRLISSALPASLGTTTVSYDTAGEMLKITDGAGVERDFTYDLRGRTTSVSNAQGTTTSAYNEDNTLFSVLQPTSPSATTLTYTWDNLRRLTARVGTVGSTVTSTQNFTYDAVGNQLTATVTGNTAATLKAAYDLANRPCALYQGSGTTSATCGMTAGAGITTYAYTGTQLASLADVAGTFSEKYNQGDGSGLLTSMSNPLDAATLSLGYDAWGRNTSQTDGSGLTTCTTYGTNDGRVSLRTMKAAACLQSSPTVSFAQTYDQAGNVKTLAQSVPGYTAANQGTWTYAHDAAGRLSTATDPAAAVTSVYYDGASNMCWRAQAAMPANPSCASPPSGATTYTYSAGYLATSVTSGTTTAYTTNPIGELTSVKVGSGTATTYGYDPWGNQVSAVIPTGLPGAGTYAYTWDALGRMLTDAKSGGSTTTFAYIGASFDPVTTKVGTTTTTYAVSPLGPLAQKTGTATTYLVRSLHGDVVGLVASGAATVTSPVAYDPWGQVRTGTAGSKLGFQGDPTDAATGMVNMQHRLYVPGLGRFATQDAVFGQVSSPASLNQFIYGGDSPVTMSDPTGMGTVDKNGYVNGTTYNPPATTTTSTSTSTGHSCHTRCGHGWSTYDRYDLTLAYIYAQMMQNARYEKGLLGDLNDSCRAIGYAGGCLLSIHSYMASDLYSHVHGGGPWDFKQTLLDWLRLTRGGDDHFPIRGDTEHEFRYDLWANLHFGYVGAAAGFSQAELQFAQRHDGGVSSAADDISVQIGIDLWNEHGPDLQPIDIQQAILAAVPDYVVAQTVDTRISFLQPWTNGI